jgi:intracellular sulfur oxidation DsrE/DsrF family protein
VEDAMMHSFPSACRLLVLAIAAGFASLGPIALAQPDDQAALAGLRDVKTAFDITEGDGKMLLLKLTVIDETRQSLLRQGVTAHFVLAFRSGTTRLVQTNLEKLNPEQREYAAKIAAKLKELRQAPGIESLEQCGVAMRLAEVSSEHLLPELTVVGNSWISLMAYQTRGYAYIQP